jgi:ATP-binding cassette subfamily F protein 3
MAGRVAAGGNLRVGYFAQHMVEELVPGETPLQHMTRMLPGARPGDVRTQLGHFGFSGDKANLEVHKLSGGERARLALALITRDAPHMLILDEPTNHLDVDAREALVQALNEYGGAVVVVSHDRHMLELTADRLVLVADGTAKEFRGSLDDYRDIVLGRAGGRDGGRDRGRAGGHDRGRGPGGGEDGAKDRGKQVGRVSRKDERRLAAQARERSQALREAVKQAEAEVSLLANRRAEIDRALLDPQNAAAPSKDSPAARLMKARAEIERKLAAAEDRWLRASEALERAGTASADPAE